MDSAALAAASGPQLELPITALPRNCPTSPQPAHTCWLSPAHFSPHSSLLPFSFAVFAAAAAASCAAAASSAHQSSAPAAAAPERLFPLLRLVPDPALSVDEVLLSDDAHASLCALLPAAARNGLRLSLPLAVPTPAVVATAAASAAGADAAGPARRLVLSAVAGSAPLPELIRTHLPATLNDTRANSNSGSSNSDVCEGGSTGEGEHRCGPRLAALLARQLAGFPLATAAAAAEADASASTHSSTDAAAVAQQPLLACVPVRYLTRVYWFHAHCPVLFTAAAPVYAVDSNTSAVMLPTVPSAQQRRHDGLQSASSVSTSSVAVASAPAFPAPVAAAVPSLRAHLLQSLLFTPARAAAFALSPPGDGDSNNADSSNANNVSPVVRVSPAACVLTGPARGGKSRASSLASAPASAASDSSASAGTNSSVGPVHGPWARVTVSARDLLTGVPTVTYTPAPALGAAAAYIKHAQSSSSSRSLVTSDDVADAAVAAATAAATASTAAAASAAAAPAATAAAAAAGQHATADAVVAAWTAAVAAAAAAVSAAAAAAVPLLALAQSQSSSQPLSLLLAAASKGAVGVVVVVDDVDAVIPSPFDDEDGDDESGNNSSDAGSKSSGSGSHGTGKGKQGVAAAPDSSMGALLTAFVRSLAYQLPATAAHGRSAAAETVVAASPVSVVLVSRHTALPRALRALLTLGDDAPLPSSTSLEQQKQRQSVADVAPVVGAGAIPIFAVPLPSATDRALLAMHTLAPALTTTTLAATETATASTASSAVRSATPAMATMTALLRSLRPAAPAALRLTVAPSEEEDTAVAALAALAARTADPGASVDAVIGFDDLALAFREWYLETHSNSSTDVVRAPALPPLETDIITTLSALTHSSASPAARVTAALSLCNAAHCSSQLPVPLRGLLTAAAAVARATAGLAAGDVVAATEAWARAAAAAALTQHTSASSAGGNTSAAVTESDESESSPAPLSLSSVAAAATQTRAAAAARDGAAAAAAAAASLPVSGSATATVGLADIAGYPELKVRLSLLVSHWRRADTAARLGARPPQGLLLHGPSGVGKTRLAAALAEASGLAVLRLGCADVLQRFLGESERVLRAVFRRAADAAPCVVIIDEVDVIAPNRAVASASTTGTSQLVSLFVYVEFHCSILVFLIFSPTK